MTSLEVEDIVLCTVDRIVGTTVFVKIDDIGEGSIIFSEIAPGRIRNIRDYVVPKKRIVCKVLRISGDRIDLSLRRVTQKETKEIIERSKQEQSYKAVLKSVLGDNAQKAIDKITKERSITEFCEAAKTDLSELKKIVGEENAEKIQEILKKQKKKRTELKKEFALSSTSPDGLNEVKKVLSDHKKVLIKYISAGKYSIKSEAEDLKKADNLIRGVLNEIEKHAKKNGMKFSIKEK